MDNAEQRQPRPEFIDELYANSEPLTVQRHTGSVDCITYITTEKAIQICEKYISRPIEQQVSPLKVWIVEGYDSLTGADEIKGVFSTEEKAKKYLFDNNYFGEPTEYEVI